MALKNRPTNSPAKNELAITRILNAPRELVWEVWTNPEHIAKWWGPNCFTNTIHQMEVKDGGEFNFIMHGPDGTDYPNEIVFNKLVKPELIAYSHVNAPKFDTTVTFKKYGDKTKVNIVMEFNSAKDYDIAVNVHGAKVGLEQHIGRLKNFVEKMNAK
jgi:uncharacterized protein YndB with AHSA1/START domain